MLNSLQILRGLAAWMVVFRHIVQSYFMEQVGSSFWIFFACYGAYGIDIFFVLSGFVMALVASKHQPSGVVFGVNRFFRVIPGYWFFTLLLVVSILVFPAGTYLTWWADYSLIKSLLFIPNVNPNGYGYFPTLYVGWTLIYEMFFYVVFTVVLLLKIPKPSIACAVILAIIAVLFKETRFLGYTPLLLLEFSIGIIVFEYLSMTKDKNILLRIVLPISFFLLALMVSVYIKQQYYIKYINAGLIVYVFILMEKLFSQKIKLWKFLKVLGDYSYSTYLNHIIIIGWGYYFFGGKGTGVLECIGVLAILVVVFFVSKYSYKWIETGKYISYSKRLCVEMLTVKSK